VKTPVELPGIVVRDVHYQVRDAVSGLIEVPFDTTFNSTRASSDTSGMYFTLDASNLTVERTYVIDVMVVTNSSRRVYKTASVTFKVTDLT
jgi:hypothetical protein